jgi:hypothetical protein
MDAKKHYQKPIKAKNIISEATLPNGRRVVKFATTPFKYVLAHFCQNVVHFGNSEAALRKKLADIVACGWAADEFFILETQIKEIKKPTFSTANTFG